MNSTFVTGFEKVNVYTKPYALCVINLKYCTIVKMSCSEVFEVFVFIRIMCSSNIQLYFITSMCSIMQNNFRRN